MQLRVYVNDAVQDIAVPETMLSEASEFFDKMDADMNNGYQMSRTWVANPNQEQRCQIAGDRILTALTNGNQKMGTLMAAYILKRAPQVQAIYFNIEGDMTEHEIITVGQIQ
uniref:Uncharacterized protein n=1 Tax=uncultured Thiotrichaceae bacterium TaxID=298394 RepID=A0A6S6TMW9_9GAMM|nr:MAG: Unknown protein [uncultured Thiotrichaceae bacterium]